MIEDADFRVKTSWRYHRKRKRLRRRLGADGVLAIEDLWAHCADCKPDGDLSGLSNEDIADEVDWMGDPDELLAAFTDLRLVDGEEGSYRMHDWADHQQWLANKSKRKAKAKAAAEARWGTTDSEDDAKNKTSNAPSIKNDARSMPQAARTGAKIEKSHAPEPEPVPDPEPDPEPEQKNENRRALELIPSEVIQPGKPAEISLADGVQRVVDYYLEYFPKREKSAGSLAVRNKIRKRLKPKPKGDGYTPEDLCGAIDGMMRSEFHQENKHDSLELVVRNATKVDQFLAKARDGPRLTGWAKGTMDFINEDLSNGTEPN